MKKTWSLIIVIIGTIGILSHVIYDIVIEYPENPIMSINIFKYFTIQSNILAIIYFWIVFSLKLDEKNKIFKNMIGAVTIYITITFFVFIIFLEPIYSPKGLNLLGSICLHYINPILVIGFLGYNRKDYEFNKRDVKYWVIYPGLYLIFVIIWGSIINDYLYPFFQVSEIGVSGLIINIVGLLAFFILLSFSLVKIVSKK